MAPKDLGVSFTNTPANCDLDALATKAGNAIGLANAGIIAAAAAQGTANTAESDAQTGITNAAAAQTTANTALAAALAGSGFTGLSIYNVKAAPFNAKGNGIADDTAAIQAASTACDSAGGGWLYFPAGTYLITGTITCTRKVSLWGAGATVTTIKATTLQKVKFKGPALSWGGQVCQHLGFQKVDLILGELVTDEAQGTAVLDCLFLFCTNSIYFGFNCFFTNVERCKMVACVNGSFVDFTTGGFTSGASMRWKSCEFHDDGSGTSQVGVKFSGTSNPTAYLLNCEYERLAVAGVQIIGGSNRSYYMLRDSDFQLMGASAFHVINDGAVVQIDGFQSFSATEAGWFNLTGGRTFLSRYFGNWTPNKLVKITGGILTVDQSACYTPARLWGGGMQPFLVAGSTVGGKVVAPRQKITTMSAIDSTIMTDASPSAAAIQISVPGDGNERYYSMELHTTAAVASDNTLRIQFADGLTSINLDFPLPLFIGTGKIRVSYVPGGTIKASIIYSGGTPGATTTVGLARSGADTMLQSQPKFIQFSTNKSGATAATQQIVNLVEETSGPFTADT